MLLLSTKSCQFIDSKNLRLAMQLLIETCSIACCCESEWINCAIVNPDSDNHCSIQVRGKARARAALCPCNRRTNSETKEPPMGGFERAISAITRIRLLGSSS